LGWIETSEFRNFAHGRYINSFRDVERTGFVLFRTADDASAENAMFDVLSEEFPVLRIASNRTGLFAECELLIRMFYLCHSVAGSKQINLTGPAVPDGGRALFSGRGVYPHMELPTDRVDAVVAAIVDAKRDAAEEAGVDRQTATEAVSSSVVRAAFTLALTEQYVALGLDFDGTMVPLYSGNDSPSSEIVQELQRLTARNVQIGIFTGRGQSVVRGLRQVVDCSKWSRITVFLYNGALWWDLESDRPSAVTDIRDISSALRVIDGLPPDLSALFTKVSASSFNCQISIDLKRDCDYGIQKTAMSAITQALAGAGLAVASSGRSIDIFPAAVSKLKALRRWSSQMASGRWGSRVLCIGDRGDHGGNDHDLLGTSGGFSVDRIDWLPDRCFPAAALFSADLKGPLLTAKFLSALSAAEDGRVTISHAKCFETLS
jgi:hydroxymethylpyrimidine pyrophosphatase-like HAD family hydrolase